jgi:hydroxymethylpyrimidine/phosphomethylpyrimidine kinase
VLIIAGSDSGGGAGIQADIKTVTALGGFAATAVTALTIQNTLGVSGVVATPPKAVRAQMEAVLMDIGADVLKTGMLGDKLLVETIAEAFGDFAPKTARVIDPVMVSSSGDILLPKEAVDAVRQLMVPHAALVTPNAPEAEVLTGKAVDTLDGQRRAAEKLLDMGAIAALVKGAHVGGDVIVDVLATQSGEHFFDGPRIVTRATHGTGCTLASGIAWTHVQVSLHALDLESASFVIPFCQLMVLHTHTPQGLDHRSELPRLKKLLDMGSKYTHTEPIMR